MMAIFTEINDSNLPQDELEQILLKVPYRSLSRFRCVSKFWNSLLTSPLFLPPRFSDFIKHHSYDQSVILQLSLPPTILDNDSETHKLFCLSSRNNSSCAVNALFPSANIFGSTKFKISGHCNGIICLSRRYYSENEVILYNPATLQFKSLPNSVMWDHSLLTLAVGMGYDSGNDDYMVVRINSNGVEEYSLNADSWRSLSNRNYGYGDYYRFALFFKGTYYWWDSSTKRQGNSSPVILGLNMGDDVFCPVSEPKLPDELRKLNDSKHLAVCKETVCLIYSYDFGPSLSKIDMWVMSNNNNNNNNSEFVGGEVSWTKIISMAKIPFGWVQPMAFWKGNELLLQTSLYGMIKSFKVDTEEIEDIKVEGWPILCASDHEAVNYVATLVSIKGGSYLP